jgi:uncharacterized protein with HEPN domain
MRSPRERLLDIQDAIAKIQARLPKDKASFLSDELTQVWMVHHVMIIGEAVRAIDPAFKNKHPSIPWAEISGMRNVIVHDYFRINHERVWATICEDIPELKKEIEGLLRVVPD